MPRKWLFILPNLFTVSSIFCGIYAITLATGATGETAQHDFFRAAVAILFGMFFDGLDGRVARLTKTESEFGVQLDSLADVMTFGAAPALLLYKWALVPLGVGGVVIAGIYASCGALRLARFNVSSAQEVGPSNHFTGLPIPLAAGMVVSLVIAATRAPVPQVVGAGAAATLSLVLSYLMVSTIKYHSFKKVKFHGKELAIVAAVIAFGVLVGTLIRPSFVLISYFSGYVLLGLVEAILQRPKPAAAAPGGAAVVDDASDDDDEEEDED